jgi:hypothetical protein
VKLQVNKKEYEINRSVNLFYGTPINNSGTITYGSAIRASTTISYENKKAKRLGLALKKIFLL